MKYISLLALIIIFSNCSKHREDCPNTPEYQQLSASAKEWFPYTGNRQLIFENNLQQKDTLQLQNFFSGDDEVWNGDECDITKSQYLRGNIIDKKSGDTIKAEIGQGDRVIFQKGNSYILYYETRGVLILASEYRRFETSIQINGKNYTQVLAYECAPSDNCTPSGITRFYVSKTKGLVAFVRNGVTFTLL